MDDSTSSGSHTDYNLDAFPDPPSCSLCQVEIGFGLLLPKRTRCKFCRRVVCAGCSKTRALNPATNKVQRICSQCRMRMSERYSLTYHYSPEPNAAPAALPVPNNAVTQGELSSSKRENNTEDAVSLVSAEIAEVRAEADVLNKEKDELAKMLVREKKARAKEAKKLETAMKKLALFKKKLGTVVCDMSFEE